MAIDHPRGTQPHTGHPNQRNSAGPPHAHTRALSTWVADPDSPPRGRAAGGGRAPDLRRPSLRRKAPPPGTPSRHPHSAQRRLVRAHAVGPLLGSHAHTKRGRDHGPGLGTLAARPKGRAAGGGTAPDTRRSSQRWKANVPPDGLPAPPRHAAPRRACKPKGQC